MRQTIALADGYNGATELFDAAPVRRDDQSGSVLLQCARPGFGHLLRWAPAGEYRAALGIACRTATNPAKGEVAVLIEIGAEKLRYLTGVAQAVDWSGKRIELSLEYIYAMAAREFGVRQDRITHASY